MAIGNPAGFWPLCRLVGKPKVFQWLENFWRGGKPHLRKSRDAFSKGAAPLPEVRHLAAPKRTERGRDAVQAWRVRQRVERVAMRARVLRRERMMRR